MLAEQPSTSTLVLSDVAQLELQVQVAHWHVTLPQLESFKLLLPCPLAASLLSLALSRADLHRPHDPPAPQLTSESIVRLGNSFGSEILRVFFYPNISFSVLS